MKCPLLIAAAITHDEKIEDLAVECGKEECAWWVSICNQCSLPLLAINIAATCSTISEINEKMPKGSLFGKKVF